MFLAGIATGAVATAVAARIINHRRSGRRNLSLSQLAHDLRTPLSSITAYAEILNDEDAIDPAERSRFAGIILDEAVRMEAMIDGRLGVCHPGNERGPRDAEAPSPGVVPAGPGSRTILVVDDDRFLVEATRTMLTREGFVALGASGGMEALTQARARRPDLILMDMGMPGMSGEETLGRLRGDMATREIPVIITTGDDDLTAIEGAAAILTKPVTRDRLIAAIEAVAGSARILGGNQA